VLGGVKSFLSTLKKKVEEKTFFNQPDITDPLVGGIGCFVTLPLLYIIELFRNFKFLNNYR
jgi:hypothetical protein